MGPLAAIALLAGAVESFQVAAYNETQAEGRNLVYNETDVWLQKSWSAFDRSTQTFYIGLESLVEPSEQSDVRRYGVDVGSAIIGYKRRTYLPDWYTFNIRLRVPVMRPHDPFGAPRRWSDRLQLRADPVIVAKTWNLFTLYDRNRLTLTPQYLEYGNKLKLIQTTPDLEFPIAMYAGLDLRLRQEFDGSRMARGDALVGMASNFTDWMHLAVDLKYRTSTDPGGTNRFLGEVYLEMSWDVFFDNTFGSASSRRPRSVSESAKD
jgi:hypothetical protein